MCLDCHVFHVSLFTLTCEHAGRPGTNHRARRIICTAPNRPVDASDGGAAAMGPDVADGLHLIRRDKTEKCCCRGIHALIRPAFDPSQRRFISVRRPPVYPPLGCQRGHIAGGTSPISVSQHQRLKRVGDHLCPGQTHTHTHALITASNVINCVH